MPRASLRMPGQVHAHWDFVLHGQGQEGWRINLEIDEGRGNRSRDPDLVALPGQLERDLLVVCGLAGELDFEIGLNCSQGRRGFGQARANDDHGKLCAAGYLDHMEIAVAVARIEGLHWYGDQKVALPVMANSFATHLMADAFRLVKRMRHMVGEGALL